MKWGIGLLIMFLSHAGLACPMKDPETTFTAPAITRLDAEHELTKTLLATEQSWSEYWQDAESIDCYLMQHTEFYPLLETIRPALADLSKTGGSATQAARQATINKINLSIARDTGTGFIQFPDRNDGSISINLYDELLTPFCATEASIDCARATLLAQNLWHIAGYYRALSEDLNQADKAASLQFNQSLDTQWRSYKDDTIKLWPHEVLLNSLVYTPRKTGLSGPPNFKLLALRPALGLSYLSDQPHRIQPTLNVDLLGIYWWHYSGGQHGPAMPGRGIAASLIWSGDDTAYGLTYHHNPKWSVSLAHGDDNDLVMSVSFQLAYWLLH